MRGLLTICIGTSITQCKTEIGLSFSHIPYIKILILVKQNILPICTSQPSDSTGRFWVLSGIGSCRPFNSLLYYMYAKRLQAMQETINTARENKDMACLNFALSWFYHFHKAHPQDCPEVISSRMERESLQFLKAKAKEAGMHHLQSMAHLSEAKQLLVGVRFHNI